MKNKTNCARSQIFNSSTPAATAGVQEQKKEDTDQTTVGFGVNIKNHNLEHSDRLGKKQSSRTKPRPVFVKFVRYNDRRKVFSIKKMKASDNSITESLPPFRMGATCERARRVGIQKCLDLRWSNNLYK